MKFNTKIDYRLVKNISYSYLFHVHVKFLVFSMYKKCKQKICVCIYISCNVTQALLNLKLDGVVYKMPKIFIYLSFYPPIYSRWMSKVYYQAQDRG